METFDDHRRTEEEEDNLARSMKQSKDRGQSSLTINTNPTVDGGGTNGRDERMSNRDKPSGSAEKTSMEVNSSEEDGDVSDDDPIEDEGRSPWFKMGMSKK